MDNAYLSQKLRELSTELAVGSASRQSLADVLTKLAEEIDETERAFFTEMMNES